VLALALGLALAELAVRLSLGAPLTEQFPLMRIQANPHRGWGMVPGEDHTTYHHPVSINALGLRGPEVGTRQAGELRVLALGDSLVYGQGVGDGDTVPSRLQAILEESDPRGRDWTVVNGGHRAYSTVEALALLQELGPAIEPDLVLVFWYWNDPLERDVAGVFQRLADSGPVVFDTGLPRGSGGEWRWRARQWLRRSALLMTLHDAVTRITRRPTDLDLRRGLDRLRFYLDGFQVAADDLGARLALVVIPDAQGIAVAEFGGHRTAEIEAAALAIAARRAWPTLSLLGPLRDLYQEQGRLPLIPYDGHYDASANEAMAQDAARFVLGLDLKEREEGS